MNIVLLFTSKNIIHSVNWFILYILNVAFLFLILEYKFLALSIIIIHIGAIAILFLFSIMLVNLDLIIQFSKNFWSNFLFIFVYLISISTINLEYNHFIKNINLKWNIKQFNGIDLLSYNFYNINMDIFLITTLILFIGLLGVLELQLPSSINNDK